MEDTREQQAKMLRREARKLAEDHGLIWKDLPRETRKEFKQRVRASRREHKNKEGEK
jgi:hypothetical protein